MKTIICLLFSVLIIAPVNVHAATSYAGIWNFKMKVLNTTCTAEGSLAVGDYKTLSIKMTQKNKVLSGTLYHNPPLVGVDTNFTGYLTKGGLIMSLGSSCPVTLNPVCSRASESFVFENSSKKKAKLTWLTVTRSDNSAYTCSTIYSGQARKQLRKRAKSKK